MREGHLRLGLGHPLTGLTRDWPHPRTGYEVELEAARIAGADFFCGLTFPVGDGELTLILGGWGGSLVGLSCLDGRDASENETTQYIGFERNRRYTVRVRVDIGRVRVWLDEKTIVDLDVSDRVLSLRPEVEPSSPFGIASFVTEAEIGPIRYRPISSDSLASPASSKETN